MDGKLMTLDETAARLEGLLERATKGDWYTLGPPWSGRGTAILAGSPDPHVATWIADLDFAGHDDLSLSDDPDADADLITDMKNALPALLSERRALREECERLRAIIAEAVPIIDQIKADVLRPPSRDSQDRRVERAAMWLVKGAQFTANGGEHD